jgi:hypothetical protein
VKRRDPLTLYPGWVKINVSKSPDFCNDREAQKAEIVAILLGLIFGDRLVSSPSFFYRRIHNIDLKPILVGIFQTILQVVKRNGYKGGSGFMGPFD